MQVSQLPGLGGVDLDDDRRCGIHQEMRQSAGGRRDQITLLIDPQSFDDRNINRAQAAASDQAGHSVHLLLDVMDGSGIDLPGQQRMGAHGCSASENTRSTQLLIEGWHIGPCDQVDRQGFALCPAADQLSHDSLRIAGHAVTAHGHRHAVPDDRSGLFC